MRSAGLAAAALIIAGCSSASHPHARATPRKPSPSSSSSSTQDPYHSGGRPLPLPSSVPTGCRATGRHLYTEGGHTRARVVALTFDDGPSDYTHHVLDVLERERVHATFFVIGNQVADQPDQVRRALRDGDLLANHTYTHDDMLKVPLPRFIDEIAGTQRAIWQDTGFTPCLWRAPYGSLDLQLAYVARAFGMDTVQWNVDPFDYTVPPAPTIVQRVLHGNRHDPDPGVRPGSIVLLHDGGGNRSHTVAALPRIIDALRRDGYRFVTVAQLLGLHLVYGRPAEALKGPRNPEVGPQISTG